MDGWKEGRCGDGLFCVGGRCGLVGKVRWGGVEEELVGWVGDREREIV